MPPLAGSFLSSRVKYLYRMTLGSVSLREVVSMFRIFNATDYVMGAVAKLALLINPEK